MTPPARQPDSRARTDEPSQTHLADRYRQVRRFSELIAEPLSAEDCSIQSMPEGSPIRWHLAHTTWFFETFLLKPLPSYRIFDSSFEYLFNSYYNAVGKQFPRAKRGMISRPGLSETFKYRRYVDQALVELIDSGMTRSQTEILETGLNHEQQHQELMFTDIKHALFQNPTDPVYCNGRTSENTSPPPPSQEWISCPETLAWIGAAPTGFAFDNERPQHRHFLQSYELSTRCVTNGEYLQFIEDGGYQRPEFWLSQGWAAVQAGHWTAPLYWSSDEEQGKSVFTLAGRRPIHPDEPICHISYFEADAYARWAGYRLPTEQEWEHALEQDCGHESANLSGHWSDLLLNSGYAIHPRIEPASPPGHRLINPLGNVWEWTSSPYSPYPGYAPLPGALGEYNGKFMCNQFVLRGGSCATPSGHVRMTYRNFFPPESRWQFSGIRLAQ